jgi:hypothetical protein
MPRILSRLRIDEVSAVDRAAGEGTKIVLMKRDDSKPHVEEAARASYEKFLKIFTKADAADDGDDDGGGLTNHPVIQMARLLVASGRFGDHGQALHHLLNTSTGQALLARMHKAADQPTEKEQPTMSSIESFQNVAKTHGVPGIVEIAKNI